MSALRMPLYDHLKGLAIEARPCSRFRVQQDLLHVPRDLSAIPNSVVFEFLRSSNQRSASVNGHQDRVQPREPVEQSLHVW